MTKKSNCSEIKTDGDKISINTENHITSHSSIKNNLFDQLTSFTNLSSIIQWPQTSPACKNVLGEKSICFVSFCSGPSFPIIEKSVKISESGAIYFGIFGQEINSTVLGITPSNDIYELANNINKFAQLKVCHGGPSALEFTKFNRNLCSVSSTGQLKHNKCLQIISNNCLNCGRCRRLKNVLIKQKQRQETGNQSCNFSPTKKIIVDKLRRTKFNLQKRYNRAKTKITDLKLKLSKIQIDMAKMSDECIENNINQCKNMNESQKILLRECFAASRVKNAKSRRYSEDWMMLCLLFNIRSPGAYKYLRNSSLLPLPHPKTVRNHLSLVKTSCGFDQDFLRLLAKKVELMTEQEKHGVLIFDAVNLRKSLHVNTSNLTYSGLEDYGDDVPGSNHKEYADHALVFMFQSLGSSFYQTIGCFASKSEVKG